MNDELALLWMVNMGCIDLNTWYSRVDKPDRPDFVLFDLDPSAGVGFGETVQVALLVKEVLDALGLESFPKTSGADGIHVLVPIDAPAHVRGHAPVRRDRRRRARARPSAGSSTTEWTKAKRRGVLIDANQNGEGKTIASVYSVRPKAGRAGLDAAALGGGRRVARPGSFTMEVVRDRVAKHGDLYEGVLKTKQSLSAALNTLRYRYGAVTCGCQDQRMRWLTVAWLLSVAGCGSDGRPREGEEDRDGEGSKELHARLARLPRLHDLLCLP